MSRAGPVPGAGGPGLGVRGRVVQDRVPPSADGGRREVFILPLRARDHFILYCEGELAGRQVRMARLLGEGPTSRPPQSPSCPPPPVASAQEKPPRRQQVPRHGLVSAGDAVGAGRQRQCRGGPHHSPGNSLQHHPRLRSSGGCLRGESGVCMDPEWEGNSSSWGFITGTRLRQA